EKSAKIGLEAQMHIADIYLNHLNNHELAILQYQKILKDYKSSVDPDEYQFLIGKAYFMKSDYNQAIIEFKALLDSHPDSQHAQDALYHMALCHFIGGEPQKAADIYSDILKRFHHGKYDYDARLGLGMSYEEMEQFDKALDVYKRMEKQYPDKPLVKKKLETLDARSSQAKKE
ncbi:MAG: tetratricopeptide repeat protein, partial [Nitrospinota bacterium]|nr:tetratricopeptide repeat protein [Nitrospinota bacterium]